MSNENEKSHKPEVFVDNQAYDWDQPTITGAQLRVLAAIPQDVQIFHKVPGHPDVQVSDSTVINLSVIKGPDRFSTQAVGSQAG